jgi:hypothetical protein
MRILSLSALLLSLLTRPEMMQRDEAPPASPNSVTLRLHAPASA